MKAYIVAHARKIRTAAGTYHVARHNNRAAVYDEAGKPLVPWIRYPANRVINELHSDSQEVAARRAARIAEAALKRKPQKNAAHAIEFTISASPEWFAGLNPDGCRAYFDAARASLGRQYGAENVIGWSIHYDEETPHMHVLMVPLVKDKDSWRYSSSQFLGGRADLVALQDQLAADLARFGVVRGERGSQARHTDQHEWQRNLTRQAREMQRQAEEVNAMFSAREAELQAKEQEANRIYGLLTQAQRTWVTPRLKREHGGGFER